ncbi:MAG: hypothetical protein PGN16_17600 [Sphingomonas phyllosphaerae]|uniref:hypothetical protein n=1 Tax=Sphingomonas phyllosphaerae TaxID=257003 RepID=UPI002FFC5476
MLLTIALALAAPISCTDVKRICRACPTGGSNAGCSNIGIACQPSIRICRQKDGMTVPANGTSTKKRGS